MKVNALLQRRATHWHVCYMIYDMFTNCSWVSTSRQWSVNCTQIENKQQYTWGDTIHKTMQKTAHTKWKAKLAKQDNKHKTNKFKKHKTIN